MKISKSKDGKTSAQVSSNQKIIYDPSISSYIIETDIIEGQLHRTVIHDSILDEMYNTSWEGKRPNRDGFYWCEKHGHEQTEPCPNCIEKEKES